MLNNNPQVVMRQALEDAIKLGAEQEAKGVAPLRTVTAAALMIGIILRELSTHPAQKTEAIGHLMRVIRLTADGDLRQTTH
jgi:hypothetical protein